MRWFGLAGNKANVPSEPKASHHHETSDNFKV